MVVTALKADGAKVREEYRGIVRVGLDKVKGNLAAVVEEEENIHDYLEHPVRQTDELIHKVTGVVLNVIAAALVYLFQNGGVEGVDGIVPTVVLIGKAFFGGVGKVLLHDEGDGDMVALIDAVAGDEAVHARAQHKALDKRRHDYVEVIILILFKPLVLLGEIFVYRAQVDILLDICLVIRAVRIEEGYELRHRGRFVTKPIGVKAVAVLFFSLLHKNLSLIICYRFAANRQYKMVQCKMQQIF